MGISSGAGLWTDSGKRTFPRRDRGAPRECRRWTDYAHDSGEVWPTPLAHQQSKPERARMPRSRRTVEIPGANRSSGRVSGTCSRLLEQSRLKVPLRRNLASGAMARWMQTLTVTELRGCPSRACSRDTHKTISGTHCECANLNRNRKRRGVRAV